MLFASPVARVLTTEPGARRGAQTPNCGGPRDTLRSLVWFVLSTNPNLGPMVDLQDWSSSNPSNYSDLHSYSASASVLVNDPTMVVMAAEMCKYADDPDEGAPTNHQFKVRVPALTSPSLTRTTARYYPSSH
jgi:hypothetical protein